MTDDTRPEDPMPCPERSAETIIRATVAVVPRDGGWTIALDGNHQIFPVFPTKDEAEQVMKTLLRSWAPPEPMPDEAEVARLRELLSRFMRYADGVPISPQEADDMMARSRAALNDTADPANVESGPAAQKETPND